MIKALRFAMFCLLCGLGLNMNAQTVETCLVVWQNDGGTTKFAFSEAPVVKYEGETLVLTTTKTSVEYPLSQLKKFTFEADPTKVEELKVTSVVKDDGIVSVYNMSGQLIKTYKSEGNQQITFATESLPVGMYIIKTNSQTFKILKK